MLNTGLVVYYRVIDQFSVHLLQLCILINGKINGQINMNIVCHCGCCQIHNTSLSTPPPVFHI